MINLKKNLKKNFTSQALIADILAAIVGPIYVLLPTAFKLNGWWGILLGAGVPYVAGKLLDRPEMCHAALAIAATHCTYVYGQGLAKSINPAQGTWALDEKNIQSSNATTGTPTTGTGVVGLYGTPTQRFLPSGESVMVYDGAGAINDYLQPEDFGGMNDYAAGVFAPEADDYKERF